MKYIEFTLTAVTAVTAKVTAIYAKRMHNNALRGRYT
jgi:hypothetical protein